MLKTDEVLSLKEHPEHLEGAPDVYVHPTAIVEPRRIGAGTRIWAFVHVMADASVGKHCNIGEHSFIESGAVVGDNVTIKNSNMVWDGVVLEDGVFVGPNVSFTNDLYPRSPRLPQVMARYRDRGWLSPTRVRQGASLGAGAVILAGITIGEFAMVGAGAVVTKDVPPFALVLGSPARVRGWVCECARPLRFQDGTATCAECGTTFVTVGTSIERVRS